MNEGSPGSIGVLRPLERRVALKVCLGLALGLTVGRRPAGAVVDPRLDRPRAGDQLVFAEGARTGRVIEPGELPLGGPRVMAFPFEPATTTVRDGSRLNEVLVLRLDPAALTPATRARAADGIVAYSAICTHQGCEAVAWDAAAGTFWCPCHDSKYDPRDNGRVVAGPARRRLAALPLRLVDGALEVGGGFTGPVGGQTH
jgi:rieske iron-sulfur protein